jgi:membrane protein DedA with SNARE-associated domain
MEVPFVRYTVLSFLGSLVWCFGLAGAGLAVGSSWQHFHERWKYADYAVAVLVLAALAYLVGRWLLRRRSEPAAGTR